jgi:hypothetical protein
LGLEGSGSGFRQYQSCGRINKGSVKLIGSSRCLTEARIPFGKPYLPIDTATESKMGEI